MPRAGLFANADLQGVQSTGACAGIFLNNVLLVIADITVLKKQTIYIHIYSTFSRIPKPLKYSPLHPVSENGRGEMITTDQSNAAFGLNGSFGILGQGTRLERPQPLSSIGTGIGLSVWP